MSFEAVPCRFRSATGPNGETEYIGLLIRPAGESSQPTPPVAPPVQRGGANQAMAPVRVLAAGTPITVTGENAPRYLVPANLSNVSVTPIPLGSTWTTPVQNRVSNNFTTPSPNQMASPCSQQPPRSLSVCSSSPMTASSPMSPPAVTQLPQQSRQQAGSRAGTSWPSSNDSSTTPDSGIQSVPGSPPSHHRDSPPTIEPCSSVCEDSRLDEEDFADMPRLIPIDQEEEEDEYCLPGPSGLEHSTTGSECETLAPVTLSITPLMDNAKISEQLIQLDPTKAYEIAAEIQKRMGVPVTTPAVGKKRKPSKREEKVLKKARRPTSSASEESKKAEEDPAQARETVFTPSDSRRLYREAMKKLMEKQLESLIERTLDEVQDLHIGERERHGRKSIKAKKTAFSTDWEALKRRRKRDEEKVLLWEKRSLSQYRTEVKKEVEEVSPKSIRFARKRKLTEIEQESVDVKPSRISPRAPQTRRTSDFSTSSLDGLRVELDYTEIPRSVCERDLPGWTVPIVRCSCTKGSCSSDVECVNRALFVQCPSTCQAPMCINKKFWKEDSVRLLSASGPKSKRALRTKIARRAGDFLGEFAGEVVPFKEAVNRHSDYQSQDEIPRILCLSSSLFIDATKKGNICRYVRHSCKPNSRLEVWSINGHLRAGLFPLVDLASNTEVTISMNGLLPVSRNCVSCPETDPKCSKNVKRARNAVLSSTDPMSSDEEKTVQETRVFLRRNRHRTIRMASRNFSPKNLLPTSGNQAAFKKILDGLQLRIRRVDGSLPFRAVSSVSLAQKVSGSVDQQLFHSVVERMLDRLDDDDLDRVYSAISSFYLPIEIKEKKGKDRIQREMDVSYLDLPNPIGSYNPDEAWPTGCANKRADAVRCECGSLEEDGKMLQCDACNFWLHTDCVGNIDENTKYYQCRLCNGEIADGIPSTDVQLPKQPELRLEGCVYFKALTNNRKIQVRQYETVYLEKVESDEHKKMLKKLTEINEKSKKRKGQNTATTKVSPSPPADNLKTPGHRKDLRIFRVERLFVAPGGHRFVFGFYYARPHETICDPSKLFHRNEVFGTPFYDTLPLDSVVGRCVVLDPDIWTLGRPTVPLFKEEDVLVCDYQIDKTQRSFEKIPVRNRFPINTQPYVFAKFDSPKDLVRDFTPFLAGERSASRNSGRLSRADGSKNFQSKQLAQKRLDSIIAKLST